MLDILQEPWPWYIGGPLLGLMVPLLLFIGNKQFGVSSSLRDICAAALPAKAEYFRYSWRDKAWRLFLVAGVIVGAALATIFLNGTAAPELSEGARALFANWGVGTVQGLVPEALYGVGELASARSLIALGFGGFLVGFGTRYADGCTSGHAIMGLSLLNLGSLIAVMGFFAGGLLVSHLVVPSLLAL
jgi:hypothetical protein